MREILFRGKRIENGEWEYGLLTIMWGQYHIVDLDDENTAYPVDSTTIGQHTGLTDKNGVKIFEGDVVQIPDDYDEFGINAGGIYAVYFAAGGFRLKPKYAKAAARGYWLEDDATVDVIGNIHDNPELLK